MLREQLAYEGAHTVAAIVIETVTGTNGILPPPPGYLAGLREICDEHGIMLVCDEVMAGFGRPSFSLNPSITYVVNINKSLT